MPGEAARGLRILVVDDDRFMLDMLPMWIEQAFPHHIPSVLTARSPREVLEVLDRECPDVVISDYDLRDVVNGVRLLETVGERCPRSVRILYSGHAREEIEHELARQTFHGFLEKPMRIQELMPPLRALVERHLPAGA